MKLSSLFVFLVSAKKKDFTPHEKLDKLEKHIDTVWGRWYAAGCDEKRRNKYDKFQQVVDRLRSSYDNCGQEEPPASRKRREDGEDGEDGEDDDSDYDFSSIDPRLSKNNKDKAAKQLGKLIKKFGADHLYQCQNGVTEEKAASLGAKWTANLMRMKCAGGYGWN